MQLPMVRQFLLHLFLIGTTTLQSEFASAALVNVANGDFSGFAFYILVRRGAIQNELDAFYLSRSSGCNGGPRLFLPEVSVLPELRYADHHPVYIGFGYVRSHDFDEYLKDNPSTSLSVSGLEVAVTIPFLARTPEAPPNYALALTKLYQRSRGVIPKINVLYPYVPVDEITLNDYDAVVRNGSDEMRFSFNRMNQPNCSAPTSIVRKEMQIFLENEFQFGLPSPDYSFCNRHCFESQFCKNAERVKCGVGRYAPNICQKWSSNDNVQCATTVAIENITKGFRDIILLGEDPINILASESYHKNFTLDLKYPCEE